MEHKYLSLSAPLSRTIQEANLANSLLKIAGQTARGWNHSDRRHPRG